MRTSSQRPLAVVTGGTSALGRELARQCIAHGFDVVLIGAGADVHDAARQLGADVAAVYSQRFDLATWDGVESAWREIQALERPVDVLLLNGGGGESVDLQEQLRLMRVNCDAAVHLAQRALPGMVGRRRGRVMVTAPAHAGTPACVGMQAFVLAFADALRAELAGTGVHVTTVHPREDAPPLVARQAFEGLLRDKGHVHAGSWRSRLRAWWALQFPTAANRRLLRAP